MGIVRGYKFPWRAGNHFSILVDSTKFLPRMLGAIAAARHYLFLEMYLVESGVIADRFIDTLVQAAERGVQVYLLFDDYGAHQLNRDDRERLHHDNIHSLYYNPLQSHSILLNLYRIFWQRIHLGLYRNHRKLLLVDGRVAFSGGAGITDEIDPPAAPELRWRENMIEIRGPVLEDWQSLFTESWKRLSKQPLTVPGITVEYFENGQSGRVTVNETRHRTGIQRSLLKQLKSARQRIWITTAYFIPSWSIRRKLKRAARNGIDVRLLLPGPVTDNPGVRYASRRYYERLLKSGVRIYEYTPRFLHAKTALCDDWVSVGSCNYDRWNLQWNLEANQEINNHELAVTVAGIFENDILDAIEYSRDEWQQRSQYMRLFEWFWRRVELVSLKVRHRRHK
ncbi:MAG: phosphatidylserine/phosphatidylglycerophosphate/cardiolipin synthase family protein [Gammaproteobacteria bacterium]|nr:phosphatidylserine/phosphatidylglycerophosphate/cardiolipin synthase family protein [Gammaproteobacteria bacterium]